MIKILNFLLMFLLVMEISAQITIKGHVSDGHVPIPYVNIAIPGTYYGTTSNESGDFRIVIPSKMKGKELHFSAIGYESKTSSIEEGNNIQIRMNPVTYTLNAISVIPEDSLAGIINKAIKKIPDNYISANSRVSGFYREVLRSDSVYLYFGEAITDMFVPSYKNNTSGNIKVIASRINRFPKNDSIPMIYFYNGIYLPISLDFIKRRAYFLNPGRVFSYRYKIEGNSIIDGSNIWKVSFSPENTKKGMYKGSLFIDPESLTISQIEFTFSDYGFEIRNKELQKGLYSIAKQVQINYAKKDEKYFLKLITDKESFFDSIAERKYIELNEYVTTNIQDENSKPIPLNEQFNWSEIFSSTAVSFSDSKWQNYNTLCIDTAIARSLTYTDGEAQRILTVSPSKQGKRNIKDILSKNSHRFFISIYSGISEVKIPEAFSFQYAPLGLHEIDVLSNNFTQINIGNKFGYRFNNQLNAFIEAEFSLNKNNYESLKVGASYSFALRNYGKKLFLSPEVKIGTTDFYVDAGTYQNSQSFRVNNRSFDAEKINIKVGQQYRSVDIGINLKKEISRRIDLSISGGNRFLLNSKPSIHLKEDSGSIFTRNKIKINGFDKFVIDETNENYWNKIKQSNWYCEFGIVLKY